MARGGQGFRLSPGRLAASVPAVELPDPDSLVDEQIEYYRARAPEYDDWWLRTGRWSSGEEFARRWEAGKEALHEALVRFHPSGDVLELAAGTGNLTCELTAVAGHVTAVDASAEALAIARRKVRDADRVTFVHADLYSWRPPRRFDAVAFGFWLSHVPPGRVRVFWQLVDAALAPGGRVFFTDNAVPVEQAAAASGHAPSIEGGAPPWSRTWVDRGVSVRELSDGRRYHIVKRAWSPAQLEAELAALGWHASVHESEGLFLHGTAARLTPG
jgi:demethylmenaquinone methyltransferase/2-methoxy-6-polyprenyl-1,4-benzoquinol methylase